MVISMRTELTNLLTYSINNIPYYNEIFKNAPEKNHSELFKKFPIINKETIIRNYEDFIPFSAQKKIIDILFSDNDLLNTIEISGEKYYIESTSGSSGMPMKLVKTLNDKIKLGQKIWKMRNQITPIDMKSFIDISHDKKYKNMPINDLINTINNYKWIHLNTYDIEQIYKYSNNRSFEKKTIILENNGSFLPVVDREKYEKELSVKIIDHYGCMEVWMIALGYDNQKLKINENIILKLVDESGNIINETDKPGNIVVTSLCQRGMPFIRYKLTDKAIFLDDNKKFIKLIPNEDRIIKTKLYGNRVFKDIICYINSHYKINYFEKIRVVQKENQDFFVYISNCSGAQEQLKKAFIKSFDLFVPNYKKNINFIFENYDNENLFKVEINEKR